MATKLPLPGGAWAMLRDPDEVTEAQTRPVEKFDRQLSGSELAMLGNDKANGRIDDAEYERRLAAILRGDDLDRAKELSDMRVGVLVESWSFDFEPSQETASQLPRPSYKELVAACTALWPKVMGIGDTAEDVDADDSPSGAVSA